MARLRCPCGSYLSNVYGPNETTGLLLTDQDTEFDDKKDCLELMDIGRDIWECSKCGRIAVNHPDRDDNTVKWYLPENGKPGGLMKFKT